MRAYLTGGSRGIGSRRDGDVGDDPGALVAAREITVNAVAPGPTATEAFKAMGEERWSPRRRWSAWASRRTRRG
jgi:hypothetical protein